ncbi:hypothetical protein [Lacticaseibacillus thailandensis]|uniref:Flavodoxin-like domain-containing protein n=1 Tax=Lacticaseibacillus thailandensis DSM 22698 = JCM 13996 TaxID=1423810 RepID=A0A0R2C702_9LACO|nr:hypothetical protein [Lacticaseibacillus thailandensis]KRM87416.1 hypothetical protein FD19_GL000920 [Lacticaseibacillus thailandensis DSM 22698 = JCM 13996]
MTTLAYFSRAGMDVVAGQPQRLAVGHTARLADDIATTLGLPAQAIVPQQPYPDDYQATIDRTRREYEQRSWPDVLTPAPLQGDVLLLGFPIWWGGLTPPRGVVATAGVPTAHDDPAVLHARW